MSSVLFIDECCPKPYAPGQFEGCGGTEHTVVRIAEGLGAIVEQHNRTEFTEADAKSFYSPLNATTLATHVICLRLPSSLIGARKRFPKAKLYLWLHDISGPQLGQEMQTIIDTKATVLCVSHWHRNQTIDRLKSVGYTGQFQVKVMYNPIEDSLVPDETPIDRNKLMWTASPHKGLDYALGIFSNLRRFNPDFRLYVSNPGYCTHPGSDSGNIHSLGSIPYSSVVDHLRSSLCLFYPNVVFPETFGMVLAESNSLGTPVITHRQGAATEVLDRPEVEAIDCRDPRRVIDRVMDWYNGNRPTVRGKKEFRLSNVLREWERLLK
jgi:glycosyltransferase involved in cell wall biosynthesis